jgi:hypothetical protein
MKKMSFLLLTAAVLLSMTASAQKKDVGGEISAGIRLGGNSGFTLKKHNNYNTSALEFIAQFDYVGDDPDLDGFSITALWEKLAPLSTSSQLSALFGVGPSLNFNQDFNFGVSGVLGFDWRLKKVPVTLQLDWMPTWYFVNASNFTFSNAAVSARYVLNRKRYKK